MDPIILSIDTSCDETAAAVTMGRRILSNVVSSQVDIHTKYGGVYPALAKRAHIERINGVVSEALKRASVAYKKLARDNGSNLPLSAVAVTQGPGLAIALEVGINKAKELVTTNNNPLTTNGSSPLPLIAVNHLEGHLLSPLAQNRAGNPNREITFPALALIVSGGNTQLVLVKKIGQYQIIGETLDDACGEALDKAARILKLGYPGGPIIERLSLSGNPQKYVLKPALVAKNNLNFSYSGLKTAFLYLVNNLPENEFAQNLNHLAASFQEAAFEQLTRKLTNAIEVYQPKTLLFGGGVMANTYLRYKLNRCVSLFGLIAYYPDKKLTGDNAAMIGIAAYYKFLRGEFITPNHLDRKPRFPL